MIPPAKGCDFFLTDTVNSLEEGLQVLILAVDIEGIEHIGLVGLRQDFHRQQELPQWGSVAKLQRLLRLPRTVRPRGLLDE